MLQKLKVIPLFIVIGKRKDIFYMYLSEALMY